jgi:SNF2 family DNA or RNA helicase
VYIKVLIAKNTIDEHVWEIINNKKQVSEYLEDGKVPASLQAEMLKILKGL